LVHLGIERKNSGNDQGPLPFLDVGQKMNTLDYVVSKYKIDLKEGSPIEIPNVGRNNIPDLLHDLDFKLGVEVGVAEGKYSQLLADVNPQMKLYGVDPYIPYEGFTDTKEQSIFDRGYKNAKERLSSRPNYEFIEEFSMDAVKRFEDDSLDFVYIDANHREPYVSQDIREWYKKVRPGGILSGHDYAVSRQIVFDVIAAIKKFTSENKINPWFVLGTWKRVPGIIRDNSRSWMIVKPI